MAFLGSLGSVVGALGSLLPGYMQGERQAVQDNWADLNYYNKAQAGTPHAPCQKSRIPAWNQSHRT